MGVGFDLWRGLAAFSTISGVYLVTWAYYKYSARKLGKRAQLLEERLGKLEKERPIDGV